MKRVAIIASGRVQGVGFRYYVQDLAERMNLGGWVRNLPDGTVEIDAEGDNVMLDEFIKMISHTQEGLIHVTNIQVQEKECCGYSQFTIRRD
jgi:acylphosphatase